MIGSQEGAEAAVREDLPLCGVGYTRRVYHSAEEGCVYKVVYSEWPEHRDVNLREHEYANDADLVGRPGIPPTTLWMVGDVNVLAMPYYPGDASDYLKYHNFDMKPQNLRYDIYGRLFITDLA